MSEQRKSEITVGTGVAEWGEELVAQWNALGETIARSVQQRSRLEQEQGEQERLAHLREVERLRAELAQSEARGASLARESAVRVEATQREYELKIASLHQQLEQREPDYRQPDLAGVVYSERLESDGTAAEAKSEEENSLEENERPIPAGLQSYAREQWLRVNSGPYLVPAAGFLAGLAVMVCLFPLLRRPSVGLAKETAKPPVNVVRAGGSGSAAPITPLIAANPASRAASDTAPTMTESSTSTPTVNVGPASQGAQAEGYAVLLAGGRLLTPDKPGAPSAVYEAQLAMRAGYDTISVYQRNDRFMAAVLFSSREEAERGLQSINADYDRRWKRTSSVVPVSEWCRAKGALQPVVINRVEVAVWSCNKTPS